MKKSLGLALLCAAPLAGHQEPAPRRLTAVPMQTSAQFMTVSGVRELKNGFVLATDAKRPAIYLIDPKTGSSTMLGSAGADSGQYVQPGGIYAGKGDTSFVLDRGQARVSIISPTGALVGVRSIKMRGFQTASDADVDYQRVDSRCLAYFTNGMGRLLGRLAGAPAPDSVSLLRFDPLRQHGDTVALLRTREKRVVSMGPNMQVTNVVVGSPEDSWGVAPDGRVAVVRASPYRVEWIAPNGSVTRGPIIAHEAIPYTAAEKQQLAAERSAHAPKVGMSSGPGGADGGSAPKPVATNDPAGMVFAPNKPPFEPDGEVIVSPEGQLWIARNLPMGAAKTIYDVFDGKGERVDRIELPASSRVIGFGQGSIYVNERGDHGVALRKYKL